MKGVTALVTLVGIALLLRSTALTALAARGIVLDVLVFATLLAKAPRWEGTLSQTRIGPVAQALQEVPAA